MQKQQHSLNQLVDEMDSLRPTYDNLPKHLIGEELQTIWNRLPEQLNERVIKQTTAIENLNHFAAEYNAIIAILRSAADSKLNESSQEPTSRIINRYRCM